MQSKYKKENGSISGLDGLLKKNNGRQKQNQDLNSQRGQKHKRKKEKEIR